MKITIERNEESYNPNDHPAGETDFYHINKEIHYILAISIEKEKLFVEISDYSDGDKRVGQFCSALENLYRIAKKQISVQMREI